MDPELKRLMDRVHDGITNMYYASQLVKINPMVPVKFAVHLDRLNMYAKETGDRLRELNLYIHKGGE